MNFTEGVTVTVHRDTIVDVDQYGQDVVATATHTIEDCAVVPRTSGPPTEWSAGAVIVGITLFAPPGANLERQDRVQVDGDMFRIDGEIAAWTSPFTGWAPGVQVALERIEGEVTL